MQIKLANAHAEFAANQKMAPIHFLIRKRHANPKCMQVKKGTNQHANEWVHSVHMHIISLWNNSKVQHTHCIWRVSISNVQNNERIRWCRHSFFVKTLCTACLTYNCKLCRALLIVRCIVRIHTHLLHSKEPHINQTGI